MDWFFHPQELFILALLVMLEIALSVDNLAGMRKHLVKLPETHRAATAITASLVGLTTRIVLVLVLLQVMKFLDPQFANTIFHSGRGVILSLGGAFLITKGFLDLKRHLRPALYPSAMERSKQSPTLWNIIAADAFLSIDSVVAAIAMANNLKLVIVAMIVAHILLNVFWKQIDNFFIRRPSMMTITLVFLMVIGIVSMVRILGLSLAEETLITALLFALTVEFLNGRTAQNPIARTDLIALSEETPVSDRSARKPRIRAAFPDTADTGTRLQAPEVATQAAPLSVPQPEVDLFAPRTCGSCSNTTFGSIGFCITCGDMMPAVSRT